ncbi:MAG: helix-turn-helix domain-containing protein [Sulfitobacter sp.]
MSRTRSLLLLPPRELSSCIAVGVFRDTKGARLSDHERFNYFPAAPLVTATHVISGEIRLVNQPGQLEEARRASPIPRVSIIPPKNLPTISWSPGPVTALTIGFYPDAWSQLGFDGPDRAALMAALSTFASAVDPVVNWTNTCAQLAKIWHSVRAASETSHWVGSDRVSDWSRYLLTRFAATGGARSARTLERRLKRFSGQTKQSLNFYASIENLHRHVVETPRGKLADVAIDAGYSDQSHMGRAVRRATGFSPGKLNHLIETEEAFWCYRLLGERF